MKYKEILNSITKELSKNFSSDVWQVKADEGVYNNDCFVVDLVPISSEAYNYCTDEKSLIISVKYFSDDKLEHIEISDKLEEIFNREIKVNDVLVEVTKCEPNFLNDEVGDYLDFLIYTTIYSNYEEKDKIEYPPVVGDIPIIIPIENMQDININRGD